MLISILTKAINFVGKNNSIQDVLYYIEKHNDKCDVAVSYVLNNHYDQLKRSLSKLEPSTKSRLIYLLKECADNI